MFDKYMCVYGLTESPEAFNTGENMFSGSLGCQYGDIFDKITNYWDEITYSKPMDVVGRMAGTAIRSEQNHSRNQIGSGNCEKLIGSLFKQ